MAFNACPMLATTDQSDELATLDDPCIASTAVWMSSMATAPNTLVTSSDDIMLGLALIGPNRAL